MYHRLAHLDATQPLRFRFDGDSQELFVAWLTDLEGKLRDVGLHPALASHLAKYRSLMPSLALLFELADDGRDTISLQHAKQAAAWCDYLKSHAERIYSMIVSPEKQGAILLTGENLAKRIRA
jgi:putative DNA primase/helicase